MTHHPVIVSIKDINDENVAYLVRCCDDPATDSWITLSVHLEDNVHDSSLQAHQERVADIHTKKVALLKKAHELLKCQAK